MANCEKCDGIGLIPDWDERYVCTMIPCSCPLGEQFKPKPADPASVPLTGRDRAAGKEKDE